jgi:ketosteroid isomerase-like protein
MRENLTYEYVLFRQCTRTVSPGGGGFRERKPEPYKAVFSHQEDVSVGNPFGPFVRGWKQVAETMVRAASLYRDGEIIGFENLAKHVTPDLAYIVEVERIKAKIGGRQEFANVALRSTSVLRPEDGGWKVVHRHADPIASAQPPETIIRQ